MNPTVVITKDELLAHWLGHRNLTRRVIEKFPEKELFEFSIGGMRPFAEMVAEMLSIAVPALEQFVCSQSTEYPDHIMSYHTKADLLGAWDADTPKIEKLFNQLSIEQFHEQLHLFGLYDYPIFYSLLYCIDNENHHRSQGYVYLRALGIEPPFFWER